MTIEELAEQRPLSADFKRALAEPRARIGLIIPSVNRMTEPQFNRFAPAGLGVHVARGRVAGGPPRTVAELTDEIAHAAGTLADAKPDLIVFHCTHTSMKEGADGETRIINLIRQTTGIDAVSTSSLVNEALRALGIKKVLVLSPYQTNADIIAYLTAAGFTVVKDVALACATPAAFEAITPQRWYELALEIQRELGDVNGQAEILQWLGDLHATAGRDAEAERAWSEAFGTYTALGDRRADGLRDRLVGRWADRHEVIPRTAIPL
ncbi:MAG TPA: hypothetical protein VGJ20_41455 [Xanthobacteraceae bacterium]